MQSQDPPTTTPAAAKTKEFNPPSATTTTTSTTIKATEYKKNVEPSSTTPLGQKQLHKCDVYAKFFPSCQALGGHKTSHRSRPPPTTPPPPKTPSSRMYLISKQEFNPPAAAAITTIKATEYKKGIEPSSTTPLGQKQSHKGDMCGKSFLPCQALGGHKTSHCSRPPPTTPPPPPPPKTPSSRMYLISNQVVAAAL
ncbi:zinc finger AZF2-like [Olea europaea subsp. europaea]|uniref:Zinc finger AZF2-like n=1 Tax=Olea europaea subsp. europaea TaxID=158383 RepID=A0A8S0QBA0_OLEEU|nr:zinc finger AZF2-like [Olea europaea subsp. europaea]